MVSQPLRFFISHTTRDFRDVKIAHRVASGLASAGIEVFIAPDSIPLGQSWEERLVSELLGQCSHFLVLATTESLRSIEVCKEIALAERALSRRLTVVPVWIGRGPHRESAEATFLGGFQSFTVQSEDDWPNLLPAIIRSLGLDPSAVTLANEVAAHTGEFVGRREVLALLGDFVTQGGGALLSFVGEPGEGKTTLLAEFVRRTRCPAFFPSRSSGSNSPEDFSDSLEAQLRFRGLLTDFAQGPSAGILRSDRARIGRWIGDMLSTAAARAGEQGHRLTLVVDALDEVEQSGVANTLYLPDRPPDNLRIIVTRRNDADVRLVVRSNFQERALADFRSEAARDIREYIHVRIDRGPLKERLAGATRDNFVDLLAEKSEFNFMYLRHAIAEIEDGASALDAVVRLPRGLIPYYEDHWRRMGMMDRRPRAELDLQRKIIYLLCESQTPMSVPRVVDILGRSSADVSHTAVQEALGQWRAFVRLDALGYRFYHQSFRDFLRRQDIVEAAGLDLGEVSSLIAEDLLAHYYAD